MRPLACLPALLALAALLLPAPARAGDAEQVALARYHLLAGHWAEATRVAADVLRDDPTDMRAHRVFIEAWIEERAAPVLAAQYAAWYAEQPEDDVRRTVRAYALAADYRNVELHCADIQALLSPLPEDPDLRYWALVTLLEVHRKSCPGDVEADRAALTGLGRKAKDGRTWRLAETLRIGPVDKAVRKELKAHRKALPWRMDVARLLWKSTATGDQLDAARDEAIAAARKAVEDDRVAVVSAASGLLAAAKLRDEAEAAALRATRMAPVDGVEPELEWTDTLMAISKASRRADPEQALAVLAHLDEEVPEAGPERAVFERTAASLLERMGEPDQALDSLRLAWLADPTDPGEANSFAYKAALAGRFLEEALQAVDAAIAQQEQERWERDPKMWEPGFAAWQESRRYRLGTFLDTRGWILHLLERDEDAAADLRAALRLYEDPVVHLHIGLVYDRLGRSVAAGEHLVLGLSAGSDDEPGLHAEARAALERLWPEQGFWDPGGVDGYLAARKAVVEAAALHDDEPVVRPPHPLTGMALPDVSFTMDGLQHHISDFEGVRIVDLWATWCGPCIAALPHLAELATGWADRGVTVLVISTDATEADVDSYFGDHRPTEYLLGWGGMEAQQALGISGIPAALIVDAEGVVVEVISGYGEGDVRIDEALERLLGPAD
jgi:tetratricopeptide (TPR) repeat protein